MESENYEIVKKFLIFNRFNINSGDVVAKFNIDYFIGGILSYEGMQRVRFAIVHPEHNSDDVLIYDNNADEWNANKYYTAFKACYQKYKFDEKENIFSVNSTTAINKHNKNYRVEITKI